MVDGGYWKASAAYVQHGYQQLCQLLHQPIKEVGTKQPSHLSGHLASTLLQVGRQSQRRLDVLLRGLRKIIHNLGIAHA